MPNRGQTTSSTRRRRSVKTVSTNSDGSQEGNDDEHGESGEYITHGMGSYVIEVETCLYNPYSNTCCSGMKLNYSSCSQFRYRHSAETRSSWST